MKTKTILALIILSLSNQLIFSQPQKRLRELTVKEEINQYFQSYYSGMYEVADIVDIDSLRGDKKYLYTSIQNPYGMLTNSFVFVTEVSDNYQGDVEGNRVGIYKDGNMVWLSGSDLSLEPSSIFAIDDINLNGTIEIITQSGYGTVILDIHSWNGTTGNLISGDGILGAEFAMGFVDVEGDGIFEIRNLSYYDGSEVWSWNGSEYGQWPNTPIAPPTELYPANNFTPHIKCFVTLQTDTLVYNYAVQNDAQSKQRINLFWVEADVDESNLKKETPAHWQSSGYANNLEGWGAPTLNNGYLIWPGESESGFKFITTGLPTIATYTTQAYNSAPSTDSMSSSEALAIYELNRTENMVWGETIGPREPDDTLNFEGFLDTLLNYNQRSYELGWITYQTTADKYDSLLSTAKTLLEGNHIPWVNSTLHNVLAEVDGDSSGNITSEAYALLRYNTEYLLENLPEVIPPVLNSITPEAAFIYINADLSDFTVTVYGRQLNDSSVVYFNGNAKTTTYVSDSILTFEVQITSDIPGNGDYPIWISNYGLNSDTLIFSRVGSLAQTIVPIFDCVQNNGDGTFTAFYGYNNNNSYSVYIPLGFNNYFQSLIIPDRGQPKVFLPGSQTDVFSVNFDGDNLTWTLNGTSVTVNKRSTPCP